MKILMTALILLGGMGVLAAALARKGEAPAGAPVESTAGRRVPVVVELFTSEGCSSCPPADAVLAALEEEQPVEGTEIIALSEHVDYWNYIGWSDPYSSAAYSARQESYAGVMGNDRIYTPQMIVDGQAEFVGSNGAKAREAITRAARAPKADVVLSRNRAAETDALAIALDIRIREVPAISSGDIAEVLFAITERRLTSSVSRGENAGRKLSHTAVVRELRALGRIDPAARSYAGVTRMAFIDGWKREDLRAIVLIQERAHRKILGAASIEIGSRQSFSSR
ncbi:MAG: DUF1223 domain-containing protein [Blastocatellia bacterium]